MLCIVIRLGAVIIGLKGPDLAIVVLGTAFVLGARGAGRIDATAALRKQGMERAAAVVLLLTFATVTFAAPGLRAVPPEQLDHYWWMTNTEIDADVPNFGRNLDKPTCAAVTYEIGADGVTRGIVVRRVVPAGDLGQVAKSAVADLHYAPAPDN